MLERLGATDRIETVMEAFRSMPSGWIPYYAGLMAGRPKAPARLGFMVTADRVARYAEDIRLCERDMRKCYPVPFSADMRKLMSFLAQKSSGLDIQFDLYPDGSFGDGLGVTVNGASHDPRQSKGYMETGPIGEIMRHIEDLGLADGRWRLMDQTCYGIRRRVFEKGRCRLVGDVVRLNAVKIRFRKGDAFLAKGYLIMKTGDLVTAEDSGGQTPEPSRLS